MKINNNLKRETSLIFVFVQLADDNLFLLERQSISLIIVWDFKGFKVKLVRF